MVVIQSAIASIMALTRTCPKCKRDQVVPASLKAKEVKCKFCGAPVPPKQTKARR